MMHRQRLIPFVLATYLACMPSYAAPQDSKEYIEIQEQINKEAKRQQELLERLRSELSAIPNNGDPESAKKKRRLETLLNQIEARIKEAASPARTLYASSKVSDPALEEYLQRFSERYNQQVNLRIHLIKRSIDEGQVTVAITINSDGSIEEVEIERSTDEYLALAVVESIIRLSPLEAFPQSISTNFDKIVYVRTIRHHLE